MEQDVPQSNISSTRTERRNVSLEKRHSVVICGLNRLLSKRRVEDKEFLIKIVSKVSEGIQTAGLAVNLILRYLFENTDFDDWGSLLDTTFVRQRMFTTPGRRSFFGKETDSKIDCMLEENLPSREPPLSSVSNSYTAMANMYVVNWKTHLQTRFESVVDSYFRKWCEEEGNQGPWWNLKNSVVGRGSSVELTPLQNEEVGMHRKILGLNEGDVFWPNERNTGTILKYFLYLSNTGLVKISLAPLNNIRNMFVDIDSTQCRMAFKTEPHSFWNINGLSKGSFTGTVSTDGISARVHFEHQKPPTSIEKKKKTKKCSVETNREMLYDGNTRMPICALDPGRTNLAEVVSEDGRRMRFTSRRYRHQSGADELERKVASMTLPLKGVLE